MEDHEKIHVNGGSRRKTHVFTEQMEDHENTWLSKLYGVRYP